MGLLTGFLGQDGRFFDLLEASADEAVQSTQLLAGFISALESGASDQQLDEFSQSRRKDKRISNEIYEALSKTFITPIEREDIQLLTRALYRIPKTVEKLGERLLITPGPLPWETLKRQAQAAGKAASIVGQMVHTLRKGASLEQGRDLSETLQIIEGDADKVLIDLLRDLYHTDRDPRAILALRDLYDICEKIIDRCRDAGNIVIHILLKNS
jgi:uncharacterized protein Yka (UPF0111/DUF47 family)